MAISRWADKLGRLVPTVHPTDGVGRDQRGADVVEFMALAEGRALVQALGGDLEPS